MSGMRSHIVKGRFHAARVAVAGWLALVLAFAVPAEAQLFGGKGLFGRKDPPPRILTEKEIGVPSPISGRAEVTKGQESTFQIEAHSKAPGAAVEFLIRTFPSAGKIVSLVANPNERNKAIVTYYADPSSGAESDAFAFAVRYRNGRYSSSARFDLDLVDVNRQSEVMIPSEIDFGNTMVGEESIQEITVRNSGNVSFERMIYLAPPWRLVEPANNKITILGGASKTLKVGFKPEMEGETSYYFSLSRSKEGTCLLKGTGEDPFAIGTKTVELSLDPVSRERVGEIQLMNRSQRPILVGARGSTRLQKSLDKEYLIAPGTVTRVPVRLAKTDTAPFDGSVEFSLENGYAQSVEVMAPVVPGKLEVEIPNSITTEVLNFGKVEAGKSTERGIRLTNVGGVAVPIDFHLPAPFRLLNNPGTQLSPLSATNVTIGLYPTASQRGPVDVTMNVFSNEETLPIRLLGNVVKAQSGVPASESNEPSAAKRGFRLSTGIHPDPNVDDGSEEGLEAYVSSKTPIKVGVPAGGGDHSASAGEGFDPLEPGKSWYDELDEETVKQFTSPLGFVTRPLVNRDYDGTIRKPEDLSVVGRDSDSITLGWTAPAKPVNAKFDVEVRATVYVQENNSHDSIWLPYDKVKFKRIGRLVKAEVEGLQPMIEYEFRVLTVDGTGKSSFPSEAFVAQTDLPMDWTWIYAGLGICLLALLGWGVFRVFKDRRAEVYQAQYVDA